MSSLPQTLVQFRTDLEYAIGREQARRQARRRRSGFVALAFSALLGATALALSVSTPWADSPGFLARAQAALTPPEGSILHVRWELTKTSRDFGCTVTVGLNELWADQTTPHRYRFILHFAPAAGGVDRRAIACAGDTPAEIGGVIGDESVMFVPPDSLKSNGRALVGPRGRFGPWDYVSFLRDALADGCANKEGRTEFDGRVVERIRVDPTCAGWTKQRGSAYWYVDPDTFLPVRFEWPNGFHIRLPSGTPELHFDIVERYLTYEYLPRTAENLALTDIRAQHPEATGP
jgi:hypothetical protein